MCFQLLEFLYGKKKNCLNYSWISSTSQDIYGKSKDNDCLLIYKIHAFFMNVWENNKLIKKKCKRDKNYTPLTIIWQPQISPLKN